MQIGCHASVWTGTFDDAGLRLAIDKTAEAGFDLIEIPLMDPDKADATAVKRMLNAAGLGVTASLGLSKKTDVSSEDPEIVAAGEAYLRRCLEFLGDVGAPTWSA
jgi:D-psicose/D-tagatose/L-ribulose 3-epimerase